MKLHILVAAALSGAALSGCATRVSDAEADRAASAMMKTSFKAQGQAGLDRLDQDEVQALCSRHPNGLPKDLAEKLEKAQLATIRYPASGKLMGDWRQGERVAQSGVGKQFNDDPKRPSGGNCYACHRLAPQELSYGTIGPSLYQFGKTRGYTDEIRKYAYGKVWNAQAYNACTNMPRFGHKGILTEQQVKDVVALLMDPASPVNK